MFLKMQKSIEFYLNHFEIQHHMNAIVHTMEYLITFRSSLYPLAEVQTYLLYVYCIFYHNLWIAQAINC